MIEKLADAKKTDVVCDLGSGDGRVLERLSKKAKKCVGVEHNKFLVSKSRKRLQNLKNVEIVHGNIFDQNLRKIDVIVAYLSRPVTGRLEKKIIDECKKGARVVLVGYRFKRLKLVKELKFGWMRINLYHV